MKKAFFMKRYFWMCLIKSHENIILFFNFCEKRIQDLINMMLDKISISDWLLKSSSSHWTAKWWRRGIHMWTYKCPITVYWIGWSKIQKVGFWISWPHFPIPDLLDLLTWSWTRTLRSTTTTGWKFRSLETRVDGSWSFTLGKPNNAATVWKSVQTALPQVMGNSARTSLRLQEQKCLFIWTA